MSKILPRTNKSVVCAAVFYLLQAVLMAAPSFSADVPTFEKDILPIFKARCAACHFPEAEHLKGGLDLSTLQSALKGGDNGPDIIPGKADVSSLVLMLEGKEEPKMPPPKKGPPLEPQQIDLIRQWINAGASAKDGTQKAKDEAKPVTKPGEFALGSKPANPSRDGQGPPEPKPTAKPAELALAAKPANEEKPEAGPLAKALAKSKKPEAAKAEVKEKLHVS